MSSSILGCRDWSQPNGGEWRRRTNLQFPGFRALALQKTYESFAWGCLRGFWPFTTGTNDRRFILLTHFVTLRPAQIHCSRPSEQERTSELRIAMSNTGAHAKVTIEENAMSYINPFPTLDVVSCGFPLHSYQEVSAMWGKNGMLSRRPYFMLL